MWFVDQGEVVLAPFDCSGFNPSRGTLDPERGHATKGEPRLLREGVAEVVKLAGHRETVD
jgi:hypothetical protein